MIYDLLVVYPMKLSVNRFYNAMSLYCIQLDFSIIGLGTFFNYSDH